MRRNSKKFSWVKNEMHEVDQRACPADLAGRLQRRCSVDSVSTIRAAGELGMRDAATLLDTTSEALFASLAERRAAVFSLLDFVDGSGDEETFDRIFVEELVLCIEGLVNELDTLTQHNQQ